VQAEMGFGEPSIVHARHFSDLPFA
jgi:hypothetical protein